MFRCLGHAGEYDTKCGEMCGSRWKDTCILIVFSCLRDTIDWRGTYKVCSDVLEVERHTYKKCAEIWRGVGGTLEKHIEDMFGCFGRHLRETYIKYVWETLERDTCIRCVRCLGDSGE